MSRCSPVRSCSLLCRRRRKAFGCRSCRRMTEPRRPPTRAQRHPRTMTRRSSIFSARPNPHRRRLPPTHWCPPLPTRHCWTLCEAPQAGASTTAGAAASADVGPDVTGTVRVDTATAAAAAARPLTNLEALAVSAAVQTAAARQGSLAPLFANLSAALASGALPQTLQQAAAQLLSLRPKLNENLSGQDVKTAFRNSGLFLEQSMPNAGGAAPSMAGLPDMKAALIVFRQTLASWLKRQPHRRPRSHKDRARHKAPHRRVQLRKGRHRQAREHKVQVLKARRLKPARCPRLRPQPCRARRR